MVRDDEIGGIIGFLRRVGNDTQDYEVKEAAHDTFFKRRATNSEREPRRSQDVDGAIIDMLRAQGAASSREIAEASGMSRAMGNAHLRRLIAAGHVEGIEPDHSPRQRYRLAG